jgi:hypothetical protein
MVVSKEGTMASERTVECGPGGWCVVFFRERDEAVSYWYGTREECEERAKGPEPHASYWLRPYDEARDGYYRDAATQTGMYDAW